MRLRGGVSNQAAGLACLLSLLSTVIVASTTKVEQLHWLAGCWAYDGADPGTVEHWMEPAGGTMLGMSRVVSDGRSIAHEYMQINETDTGSLTFTALPSGQSGASFDLLAIGEHEVTFSNPEHDFPQRIIYRLLSDEHLLGRIEGQTSQGERAVDFPMTRISCEAE